jgi:hypothetical protein
MANKKINELDSRATLTLSDLMAVGDPSTGYLYKTTISDLKTLTGAGVVSFNGRFGSVVPAEGDYSLTQLSDVIITSVSNNQVLRYNGSNWVNASIDLSGYVPYTGATGNVNLGSNTLLAAQIKATSSAGLSINANSGTQIADLGAGGGANMTLFGGLTGTSASFSSSVTGNTIVKTGGTSSQFLKADGSVDSSTYLTTSSAASTYVPLTRTITINGTAYDLSADRTWTIPTHDAVTIGTANGLSLSGQVLSLALASTSATGALSSTDWNTFNGKQATITLTTTGSSGSSTLVGATLNIPTYTLVGLGGQPALNGTGFVKISGTTISYDNSTYLTTSSAASTYVALAGTQTISGDKTFTNGITSFAMYTSDETKSLVPGGVSSLTTLYVSGDLIIDTNTLYVDSTNNRVGISTTSPLSKLHVVGTGTVVIFGEQSGTTGKQLLFGIDASSGRGEIQAVWQGTANTPLGLNPAGGNVLIGTTTDSGARLQVITTSTNAAIQVTLPSNANATILQSYSSNSGFGWKIQQDEVSTGDFRIFRRESSVDYQVLNFSRSSGAATFSNSLRVGGATGNFLIDSYTTSRIGVRCLTDISGTTNNFFIQNSGNFNYGVFGVVSASGTSTGDVYALGYTPSAGTSMTPVLNWTSGGSLLVRTTTILNPGSVNGISNMANPGDDGAWALALQNNATTNTRARGLAIRTSTDFNNGDNELLFLIGNNTPRLYVQSNGGVYNYSANNSNLSDVRTKKDIIPLESYWDKFKAIEVVKYKYKDQTHDDFNIGLIAQQVENIAPEFVNIDGFGGKEYIPEDGIPLKSIYESDLNHATIKVLQECMTKIEDQKAQIEDLKAKIK